jgi:hypothetical protein
MLGVMIESLKIQWVRDIPHAQNLTHSCIKTVAVDSARLTLGPKAVVLMQVATMALQLFLRVFGTRLKFLFVGAET